MTLESMPVPHNRLVKPTKRGLYCEAGDFFIDPWLPVKAAVVTHAHADHARPGSKRYLCASPSLPLVSERIGKGAQIESAPFGERIQRNGVTVSFHPAGHILGSAQVRIEHRGEVCVITGDYKREPDQSAEPFEVVPCGHLITEATFGMPIYRWDTKRQIREMREWVEKNRKEGATSILYGYSLGKAQRILSELRDLQIPFVVHGAVKRFVDLYRAAGIDLPQVHHGNAAARNLVRGKGVVVSPPSAMNTSWVQKFRPYEEAFVSGWMQLRGKRKQRKTNRGFVLSDHVDWNGILDTVRESGAETVGVTHGREGILVRYLQEQGLEAYGVNALLSDQEEERG